VSSWDYERRRALERLYEHASAGRVDPDILQELIELNARKDCIYTTSSCSGRVVHIRGRDPFDKRGSELLWLTHSPSECRATVCARKQPSTGRTLSWLSLQPPIIHLRARSSEVADRVVACARSAGFARACYRFEGGAYTVEVAAHDKVHLLLPAPCEVAVLLCGQLERYKARLRRLFECLLGLPCARSF